MALLESTENKITKEKKWWKCVSSRNYRTIISQL